MLRYFFLLCALFPAVSYGQQLTYAEVTNSCSWEVFAASYPSVNQLDGNDDHYPTPTSDSDWGTVPSGFQGTIDMVQQAQVNFAWAKIHRNEGWVWRIGLGETWAGRNVWVEGKVLVAAPPMYFADASTGGRAKATMTYNITDANKGASNKVQADLLIDTDAVWHQGPANWDPVDQVLRAELGDTFIEATYNNGDHNWTVKLKLRNSSGNWVYPTSPNYTYTYTTNDDEIYISHTSYVFTPAQFTTKVYIDDAAGSYDSIHTFAVTGVTGSVPHRSFQYDPSVKAEIVSVTAVP